MTPVKIKVAVRSTIPSISTKTTTIYHLKSFNTMKMTICAD